METSETPQEIKEVKEVEDDSISSTELSKNENSKKNLKKVNKKSQTQNYFQVFGVKQTSIFPKDQSTSSEIEPAQLRQLVLSVFNIEAPPRSFRVIHPALTSRTVFLMMTGLDKSRYDKFSEILPSFKQLDGNGYPKTVLQYERQRKVSQPETTFLGYSFTEQRKFENFEEMIASAHKLMDNNFPLPTDEFKWDIDCKRRFEVFGAAPCSEELLSRCKWLPEETEGAQSIIALDCEMIKTHKEGDEEDKFELARLSVVDKNGETLLDEIFKPLNPVVDLLTAVSGITQDMIDSATHTSDQGVDVLASVADRRTIIVGHGLENDFKAILLFHTRVIDTSLVYNNEKGLRYPRKPSLIKLSKKYIKKDFREEGKSHDSIDDAKISMELAIYATENAVSRLPTPPRIPEMLTKVLKSATQIDVLSNAKITPYANLNDAVRCHLIDDDEERTNELIRCIKEEKSEFVYCHYNNMVKCGLEEEEEKKAALYYNSVLERIIPVLPPGTALFVYTGNGNLERISAIKDNEMKHIEAQFCRQGLVWITTTKPEDE